MSANQANNLPFTGLFEYLVLTFPNGANPIAGLELLLTEVERGAVEILDLECIRLGTDGSGVTAPLAQVAPGTPESLAAFEGVDSGILDQDDLDTIAQSLSADTYALALVYLTHTLDPVAAAWLQAGGQAVLAGTIDPEELESALNQTTN